MIFFPFTRGGFGCRVCSKDSDNFYGVDSPGCPKSREVVNHRGEVYRLSILFSLRMSMGINGHFGR